MSTCLTRTIEDVIENILELTVDIFHGAKGVVHLAKIRNAKDACEDSIKHYLKSKPYSDDLGWNERKVCKFYNDCSAEDQKVIVTHLEKEIEKLNKDIQEMRDNKKTQTYGLFCNRKTKAEKICFDERRRDRIQGIIRILTQPQKTLTP